MGLFIRQNENRSPFQERLAEELRERAKLQSGGAEPVDQTKQSNYLKDTEQASGAMWKWLIIVIIAVAIIAAFFSIR